MSTKTTITHGDDFHVYQELGEDQKVYVKIKHDGFLQVFEGSVVVSLPPEMLDEIAKGWLENRDIFLVWDEDF